MVTYYSKPETIYNNIIIHIGNNFIIFLNTFQGRKILIFQFPNTEKKTLCHVPVWTLTINAIVFPPTFNTGIFILQKLCSILCAFYRTKQGLTGYSQNILELSCTCLYIDIFYYTLLTNWNLGLLGKAQMARQLRGGE